MSNFWDAWNLYNKSGNLPDIEWFGETTMPLEEVKCPECEGPMVSRKSKYGVFWGCKNYPKCKGTRDSMGRSKAERDLEREDEAQKPTEERFRFNREK